MTDQHPECAEPRLLDNLRQIDCGWLTSVLHAAGYEGAQVAGFALMPIGNGNVSDTVRIMLTYRAPTAAPASLVCKFRSTGEAAHAHGIASGSYHRETGSYRMVGQACRTPHLYWIDGGRENINLVMEDLTGVARAGDQIAGCSPDDARAVVTQLARLHRSFYPMTVAEAPDWATTMAATADYWAAAIARAMPVIRAEVADRLNADELAVVEGILAIAHGWYDLPLRRATLTHGDPRVDNMLFVDDDGGVQAVLIDWQLTGVRNPMHDVGYFLSGSVSIEDRRAQERDLLRHYVGIFGPGYALAEVIEDYRLQLLSGLMTTVACYGLMPLTPDFDRLLIALLHRNAAAAIDWQSIDAVRAIIA